MLSLILKQCTLLLAFLHTFLFSHTHAITNFVFFIIAKDLAMHLSMRQTVHKPAMQRLEAKEKSD